MDMMGFADVGGVTLVFQDCGHLFHRGEEGDYADGEVGRPDKGAVLFLELSQNFVLDVIPAGGAYHGGLEVLRDEAVVSPERFRECEVYAHRFAGKGRVHRADVFAAERRLDAPCTQALLDHVPHPAVS